MALYDEQNGDLDRCHGSLTDSLTHSQTLKDRATQLLIKYLSGALVTQLFFEWRKFYFSIDNKWIGALLVAKLKMFFVMFVGKISCLVDVSDLLADLG